ncbi:very-long-chain aldehyde decarbonylase CER1-like isoform X1 [Malania oleifera]|uniref:very-long-chain aldehyde decarbonylase CER1-like isoform X1 n=1 Tax=Malania oleifera TaxID=397392 RepID=UPI0025AE72E8|nr:very-long-chain aldehyde decarbonylase CER1-like isoform X1 [Malania oleifera]
MATKPGILSEWPWRGLGNFKYVVLAPFVAHSIYSYIAKDEKSTANILMIPYILWRLFHSEIWIAYSRYRTAKGTHRIIDKSIDYEQVDRERDWDDQVVLNGLLFYIGTLTIPVVKNMPVWNTEGVILTILLHTGPVEFLYYWFHRALHHHFLYSRYHSHHHSSIATEPITSVAHPFVENLVYFALFTIPLVGMMVTRTNSVIGFAGYVTYIDFMNNMGHCNFELIPKWLFTVFPPLKYLMYTPSFHSLHHTQFRTNYSLFMPMYDYIYGTTDKSSDAVYEASLQKQEESPDAVHLTHLTTPESIYHLRLGFPSLASKPQTSKWYFWVMWPLTCWSMVITWIYGRTFIIERNYFKKQKLQTWVIPRYNVQYLSQRQNESISGLIEDAILDADEKGVKVISLGLMNQGEELNRYGELYVRRHPKLQIKVVDGSSLAVAVVLNTIPKGTTQVLLRGNLSKIAYSIAFGLSQRGIQVATIHEHEHEKLKKRHGTNHGSNLVLSKNYAQKVWLIEDALTEEEQLKAAKGTLFIPFSQFPPKKMRKDCYYHNTPAMVVPTSFENMDSCENWLPRRVMSAWRVAGIVHALEGWNAHECGDTIFSIDKVWEASLRHGFQPLMISS